MIGLNLRDGSGRKILFKDGRHVGLDLYDLLISFAVIGYHDQSKQMAPKQNVSADNR